MYSYRDEYIPLYTQLISRRPSAKVSGHFYMHKVIHSRVHTGVAKIFGWQHPVCRVLSTVECRVSKSDSLLFESNHSSHLRCSISVHQRLSK